MEVRGSHQLHPPPAAIKTPHSKNNTTTVIYLQRSQLSIVVISIVVIAIDSIGWSARSVHTISLIKSTGLFPVSIFFFC
jgi:hypothetical protein